ncbi:MAG: group II intron reverse transcriptase/maturase [Actinomycetota bacterium]
MSEAKPFSISKQVVWEAYERVKANKGAAGVDSETIEEFEKELKDNLYKLWNRMSSGAYFPPPVRTVEIAKDNGGKRRLGIPTVADRIAQTVVKMYLEPLVEPHFHQNSYGYRPGKSAVEAVGVARTRCWRYDWVLDLDIKGFFDNLDWALTMRAVGKYTDSPWGLLYIERWLKAPAQLEDGTLVERSKGTPQGGVVSPLLANIFLHLAFDTWMQKVHPDVPFERYADDVVVHCKTEEQAQAVKKSIEARLARCKLELNQEKTKIAYCKDENRRGSYPNVKFDFLGYTFRPRLSKRNPSGGRGAYFVNFSPAVSNKAATKMRREMRRWRLHLWSGQNLDDMSRKCNPIIRGWINYYGRYYKSALNPVFKQLNRTLVKWAMRKYKRHRDHQRRATHWLGQVAQREPRLFAHWQMLGLRPAAG